MLKPKQAGGEGVRSAWSAGAGDYLFLDGRTIATPAFRYLIWCDGGWSEPGNRRAMLAILDQFLDRWGHQITSLTRPGQDGRPRSVPADDRLMAALRDHLAAPGAVDDWPIGLAGWIDDPHHIAAAPSLRLYQIGGLAVLALDLPADAPDLVEFAGRVTDQVAHMALRCGVAGFGFFLPPYLHSLVFALPMTTARLTAAIEITPEGGADCVRHDIAVRDDDAVPGQPGLADIGWLTLIGAPFLGRLPDLAPLERVQDVGLTWQGRDQLIIAAGPKPVWGRQAESEDINPYRQIARHLRPLMISTRLAERHLFGGDTGDPERLTRVRDYLRRFDGGV